MEEKRHHEYHTPKIKREACWLLAARSLWRCRVLLGCAVLCSSSFRGVHRPVSRLRNYGFGLESAKYRATPALSSTPSCRSGSVILHHSSDPFLRHSPALFQFSYFVLSRLFSSCTTRTSYISYAPFLPPILSFSMKVGNVLHGVLNIGNDMK